MVTRLMDSSPPQKETPLASHPTELISSTGKGWVRRVSCYKNGSRTHKPSSFKHPRGGDGISSVADDCGASEVVVPLLFQLYFRHRHSAMPFGQQFAGRSSFGQKCFIDEEQMKFPPPPFVCVCGRCQKGRCGAQRVGPHPQHS